MIDFIPLASSSRGNLYKLTDGESSLLIEAGLPIKEVKKKLEFRLSATLACLLSHSHADHSRGAKDIMKAGIDLYCTRGTADALSLNGHRLNIIKAMQKFQIGPWTIFPFDTVHDAEEPVGFVVASKEQKLLFATDTAYIKYRFKGLTHIAIEANYSSEILKRQVANRLMSHEVGLRLWKRHMSIERAEKMLSMNDLSKLEAVYLLHLSDGNSDAEDFKSRIQKITGRPVYVC